MPSSYFTTELLSLNTTTGPFRKLGRLYESCLRQQLNSSTIRLTIEKLGGYLPINALGPSSVTPILVSMMEMGAPLPLLDIYYDLSYGRKPQVLLIIDIPPDIHHILQVRKQDLYFHCHDIEPFKLFRIPYDGSRRKLHHSKLTRAPHRCLMPSSNIFFRWDYRLSNVRRSDSPYTASSENST